MADKFPIGLGHGMSSFFQDGIVISQRFLPVGDGVIEIDGSGLTAHLKLGISFFKTGLPHQRTASLAFRAVKRQERFLKFPRGIGGNSAIIGYPWIGGIPFHFRRQADQCFRWLPVGDELLQVDDFRFGGP